MPLALPLLVTVLLAAGPGDSPFAGILERIRSSQFEAGHQDAVAARLHYESHPDSAQQATRALQYVAFFEWKLGRYDTAEASARQCVAETRGQFPGEPLLARRLNLLGFIVTDRGRPEEAALSYEEALAIYERAHGPVHATVAAGWNNLAAARLDAGDLAAAQASYEKALGIYRELHGDEHADVARGLANLALAHAARSDWSTAASLLREALTMRTRLLPANDPLLDKNMLNLAGVLSDRGDWSEAEPWAVEALHRRRERLGPDHPDVANALATLAQIRRGQGDLGGAEILLRESVAIRRRSLRPEHPRTALALRELASVRREQGQPSDAEPLLLEALAIQRASRAELHPQIPATLSDLASVRSDLGDPAAAESLLTDALVIRQALFPAGNLAIAGTLLDLAALQRQRGRLETAEATLREALAILLGNYDPDHPRVSDVSARLARVLAERGRFEEAGHLARDARHVHVLSRGPSHPSVAADLEILATIHEAHDRWEDAAGLLEEACRIFELSRRRAGSGVERATFRESPYPRLAAVLLELGRHEEAWIASESARARALLDLMARLDDVDPERSRLASDLRELEERIAILHVGPGHDDATRQALRELGVRRARAEAEWAARLASEESDRTLERASSRDIAARLPEGTVLLGWLDAELAAGRRVAWAWTLRHRGSPRWTRIDADPTAPRRLRATLEEAGRWPWRVTELALYEHHARAVWDARLKPIAEEVRGAERLIVVPSGPMIDVPLEPVLTPDSTMALDRWTIRYLPAASLVSLPPGDPAVGRGSLLAVGAPEPLPRGWPPLPGARKEIETIARGSPDAEILMGARASESDLDRMADEFPHGFRELHFATHARLDADHPDRSALVLRAPGPDARAAALAGQRVHDGYLTAAEIMRDWRIPAEFVSLGGCATLGTVAPGESWLGLAYAFLQVGARDVLASHWDVDDSATAFLLERSREDSGRFGRAAALAQAKRELRDLREGDRHPWAHPAYWAGFVLVGED